MNKTLLLAATFVVTFASASIAHAQIYVAPQPVYVVQPSVVVTQQQPAPVLEYRPQLRHRGVGIGLRAALGYAGSNDLTFYGGGGVFRFIASPRFGLELAVDVNGCNEAIIVPIELSGLVFFNTRGRVQPYLIAGLDFNIIAPSAREVTMLYVGGHFGLGLEFLVGRRLGITLDARTFVQGLTDSVEGVEDNIEYGVTVNTGFNLYFPGHRRRR